MGKKQKNCRWTPYREPTTAQDSEVNATSVHIAFAEAIVE